MSYQVGVGFTRNSCIQNKVHVFVKCSAVHCSIFRSNVMTTKNLLIFYMLKTFCRHFLNIENAISTVLVYPVNSYVYDKYSAALYSCIHLTPQYNLLIFVQQVYINNVLVYPVSFKGQRMCTAGMQQHCTSVSSEIFYTT